MKKRLVIIVLTLAGIAGLLAVAHLLVPPILRSEHHALLSGHMMLITMQKRDTAETITFPVDYLREGDAVCVGGDSAWWTHLQGGAAVRVLIQGTELVGWATPIVEDPDRAKKGFQKLRPWTYKRALWSGAVFVEIQLRPFERLTAEDRRLLEVASVAGADFSAAAVAAGTETKIEGVSDVRDWHDNNASYGPVVLLSGRMGQLPHGIVSRMRCIKISFTIVFRNSPCGKHWDHP